MGADCMSCDECADEFLAMQTRVEDLERRIATLESRGSPIALLTGDVGRLQRDVAEILGRLPMIEEDVENLENAWRRGASAEPRIAALEQDIKKLREGVVDALSRVPRLEKQADDLGALTQHHEKALHEMSKSIARVTSATAQIFPKGDAPDLLSFLVSCDGSLGGSPDGEMRLIFPEGAPVPLSDLMTAASLLRAHDPAGRIEVSHEGGIAVLLRPAPKGASE